MFGFANGQRNTFFVRTLNAGRQLRELFERVRVERVHSRIHAATSVSSTLHSALFSASQMASSFSRLPV